MSMVVTPRGSEFIAGVFSGEKVVIRAPGRDRTWQTIIKHYRRSKDSTTMRYLAMFALSEVCDWELDEVGAAFGHPKGHVSRIVHQVRRELRSQFRLGAVVEEEAACEV